jgi:hypothetical protein
MGWILTIIVGGSCFQFRENRRSIHNLYSADEQFAHRRRERPEGGKRRAQCFALRFSAAAMSNASALSTSRLSSGRR